MVRYLFYTIGDLTYQSPLVPIIVNKLEMVFEVYHSLHNIQSHSLQYGIMWIHGITKAVRPYLPLTNEAMPVTVNGKQCKRMHHDGYYNSNHLFFGESHKCATDNRI